MPFNGREFEDVINVVLPADERLSRMTNRTSGETWSAAEAGDARAAAVELEAGGFTPGEPDRGLVQEVLRTLARHPGMSSSMAMAATGAGGEVGYMSLSDLTHEVGPPPGMPFFNEAINVISMLAPPEGPQVAEEALRGVGGGDIRVESAAIYNAIELMEEPARVALGYPTDGLLDAEPDQEWVEATLSVGAAAEIIPWGVVRVNARAAWARGYFGQGIRVAIVDTGSGPHVDLPTPVASATFVPGTTSANDDNGHGTHVAGTVLARQNGIGVVGVAPRALLMRAKVLSRTGSGTDAQVAAGITWAVNNGARIINLSLGSSTPSTVIDRAVAYARSRRVAICAAAGNNSTPTSCAPVIYPARNPLVIAVAATDEHNHKAFFSDCGPELDLAAPGVNILSTYPTNAYRVLNGTSMATPHVSGSGALVLSKRPGLNPAQLQLILQRTAIPLGPATQYGSGLVQADRAVAIAETSIDGRLGAGVDQVAEAERQLVGSSGQRGRRS